MQVDALRFHNLDRPLLRTAAFWLRYSIALLIVFAWVAIRIALIPVLGFSTPLLPLVPAVLMTAILVGRRPAIFASLVAPIPLLVALATYTEWQGWPQWLAHIVFFVAVGIMIAVMVDRLQEANRQQWALLEEALAAEARAIQSEEKQRSDAEVLAQRERQLKLIYDHSSDGLALIEVRTDGELILVSTNSRLLNAVDYAEAEVNGRSLKSLLPPGHYDRFRDKCDEGTQTTKSVRFEEQVDLLSGRRFIEVTLVPIVQETVKNMLACIRDVTLARGAALAQREETKRKDEFLALLAHELRNPLAPIRNVAHLLTKHTFDAERVRALANTLHRQSQQLARLVDDLLDVSRITRGAIAIRTELVNVAQIVDAAIEMTQTALEAKQQRLTVSYPPDGCTVWGDDSRLIQILSNLLTNASKYSDRNSAIDLKVEQNRGEVVFRLIDNGIGIEPAMLDRVFDLFVQADKELDRRESGLGVGLTIVKRLVELHGGQIEAKSAGLGHGSEFIVRLPLSIVSAPATAESSALLPVDVIESHRRILVVDDNIAAAQTMTSMLQLQGFSAQCAFDAQSALSLLDSEHFDVVILDISMPEMDGYVLATEIRQRHGNFIRIVAVTGYGTQRDREHAAETGFDEHFTKPVDPLKLYKFLSKNPGNERSTELFEPERLQ